MVPIAPVRLILVRHGRTEFNAQGRVQGGGRLDSLGRSQVKSVAERLAHEPLAAIYASPFTRAQQTARAIARPHGLPIRQRALLRDIHYGIYSGMLFTDARLSDPALWGRWAQAPHMVSFPEGESLGDLRGRLIRFLGEICRNHPGQSIVAVSHDSPIRVISCIAQGLGDSHHHQHVVGVASVTVVEFTSDGPRLLVHSDQQHLEGIDAV
jgi:broad specificity phosphatase PhoE